MHRCMSHPVIFIQKELQVIWSKSPCHVVKARIGNFVIHQGSFHCLQSTNLLNDEVINIHNYVYYVYKYMMYLIDCEWIFEAVSFIAR